MRNYVITYHLESDRGNYSKHTELYKDSSIDKVLESINKYTSCQNTLHEEFRAVIDYIFAENV